LAQTEIARLDELPLEAIEDRLDADLRTGLAREPGAELQGLVRQHPLGERLLTSLMVALYRCGRAACPTPSPGRSRSAAGLQMAEQSEVQHRSSPRPCEGADAGCDGAPTEHHRAP
jgi:Bacterial transcriptional activator domain